jgi:C4-dicarboxylate transporter, DctQ subunit
MSKRTPVYETILRIQAWLSIILILFLLLSVCFDVSMRYLMNRPQKWVIELSEYALLYITFLSTAWLLRNDRHVRIDLVTSRLSTKHQTLLGIFSSCVIVFVSSILVVFGSRVFLDDLLSGVYTPTPMELYRAPMILVIPVGGIFLLIEAIRRLKDSVRILKQLKS